MANRFLEGFDNWASLADGTGKGWVSSGSGTPALVTGRFAGQALAGPASAANGQLIISKAVTASAELFIGCAVRMPSVPITGAAGILALRNGSTTYVIVEFTGIGGTLKVVDAAGTSHTISGWTAPASGAWTYLELHAVASGTSGLIEVRQDGATLYSASSQSAVSTNLYDHVQFSSITTQTTSTTAGACDDLYVGDTSGSINPSWEGPLRVCTVYPTADSGTLLWTPNTGSTLYTQVNETVEDGNTSFISTSSANQLASFTMGALPGSGIGTIVAVQPVVCGINNAGTNTIETLLKSSGTVETSGTVTMTGTYSCYAPNSIEADPATGAGWTEAAVNAVIAEFENGNP